MLGKDKENIKVIGIPIQVTNPITFLEGLSLLFIGLKLGTNRLDDWTWIQVLSPVWLPFMLTWFVKLVIMTFRGEKLFGKDEEE